MKKMVTIFLLLAVVSCKNFETKKVSSHEIAREKLSHINWKSLDTYPSFKACDSLSKKTARKMCFEHHFSAHIYKELEKHTVVLKDSIYKKIDLVIAISAKGNPKLDTVKIPKTVRQQIPELKSWLNEAVGTTPKIFPAEKRGVPVAVTFNLPLIIQSQ